MAEMANNNWGTASLLLEQYINTVSGDVPVDAVCKLMKAYRKCKKLEQALTTAKTAVKRFPKNKSVLSEASLVFLRVGRHMTAARHLEALVELQKTNPSPKTYLRLAIALERGGLSEKSRAILQEGAALFPESEEFRQGAPIEASARKPTKTLVKCISEFDETFHSNVKEAHELGVKSYARLFKKGRILEAYEFKRHVAQTYTAGKASANFQAAAKVFATRYPEALALIRSRPFRYVLRLESPYLQLEAYCRVLEGEPVQPIMDELRTSHLRRLKIRHASVPRLAKNTHLFHEKVKDRSVAIVGPAKTGQNQRDEIDSFDLVARINISSNAMVDANPDVLGSRTDIVYYNTVFADKFGAELGRFLADSPNITPVLRSLRSLRLCAKAANLEPTDLPNARILSSQVPPFLSSNMAMHGIQRILWDILKFEPSRIKLFNVDFFVSGYDTLYISDDKTQVASYQTANNFGVSHDPLQSFRFTKNLWELRLMDCDPVAASILSWSEEEYLFCLQDMKQGAMRHRNKGG